MGTVVDRLKELRDRERKTKALGGVERVEKQHKSGKLTARERLDLLFDPASFHEQLIYPICAAFLPAPNLPRLLPFFLCPSVPSTGQRPCPYEFLLTNQFLYEKSYFRLNSQLRQVLKPTELSSRFTGLRYIHSSSFLV